MYSEQNVLLATGNALSGRSGQLRLLCNADTTFLAKSKQEFHCLTCKAGSEGGWMMLIHNVLYGAGCPICRHSSTLIHEMSTRFPSHRLVVTTHRCGPPVSSATRYQLFPAPDELPEDFGWQPESLGRSAITAALREGRRPGEKVERYYQDSVIAYKEFTDCFPKGLIRYKGTEAPGKTSPGPFFEIQTETRLMRSPVSTPYFSLPGLRKICRQERNDRVYNKKLIRSAHLNGAEILAYEQHSGKGLMIKYKNRMGDIRTDTPGRIKELYWGQTWIRKAEKLTAIIMQALFPSTTWAFNRGYSDFLRYISESGTVSVLELDGFNPEHGLAFEYQGVQHYMALTDTQEAKDRLKEIQRRDVFKVEQCKKSRISLVVVPNLDLDPETFLRTILELLAALDRQPVNATPDLDIIWANWNSACQNPLQRFQAKVVEKLGKHTLVSPLMERITRTTLVTYECSLCATLNEVASRSLADGKVRTYCSACKGQKTGQARSQKRLDLWEEKFALPRSFINNLRTTPMESRYFRFICGRQHVTAIHNPEHAQLHMNNGEFECPTCRSLVLGISAQQVVPQAQYRLDFNRSIELLGLKIVEDLPYQEGQMAAKVMCAAGEHSFVLLRPDLRRFQRGFFQDRSLIPSACLDCCYPGVTVGYGDVLMGTVFHRLSSLRGMYPNVRYVTGFDVEGWKEEHFNCGETLPDGSPHPDFSISWRNLQRAGKARPTTHVCNACGVSNGDIGNRGKSIRDLEAVMVLLRHELHRHKPFTQTCYSPTVTYHEGPFDPSTEVVSTTKTKLTFWCGVVGHESVTATKDNYFNRAPTKGAGFCKKCVNAAGLIKAPLPAPVPGPVKQLLPCTLRVRTRHVETDQ
ncbi:hypothetical protein BK670_10575 [Pseudomonas fluorescens]|uniref:Uncharacterized protein n=2 Tax=Pseudomonas fluorescens TaxID=294 RepID=A0A423MBI6_PSEFL|nr:hypothetical protein BK670_10575 [Pseudomonas fluorescens]